MVSAVTIRYPDEWELDALLRDGTPVHLRPIRPQDGESLVAFHERLSPETIYRRFFSPRPVLPPRDVDRFTNVDYADRMALVAVIAGEIAGVARYDATGPEEAEVAFVIEDRHQGRGLGSLLLEHLAGAARERGFRRFVAETLAENRAMLGVFRDAGFNAKTAFDGGTIHIAFSIDETPAALDAMAERERRAAVESVAALLQPRAIAVIGASRQPRSAGHAVLRNLLAGEFQGRIYPVHPEADHVSGLPAFASLRDVPGPVDLAIIAVPADQVLDVVDACGAKGVRALVVVSAGFAETGSAGADAQVELVRRARAHGMRIAGPNSMGLLNNSAATSMHATVSERRPAAGHVSFLAQSGALGIAVLQQAVELGIGLASFVSVGNRADISGNDLLQYWETDVETELILLYLESFGNPRKFARIARRVARSKPIVVVKSGRGPDAAIPDAAIDALFRQTGVIRVDTLAQLFDVTLVLAHQPLAAGRRLGIVGNATGVGVLAADTCAAAGLRLTEFVDLGSGASAADYERAAVALAARDDVDSILVLIAPPLAGLLEGVASALGLLASRAGKPIVANVLGWRPSAGVLPGTESLLRPIPYFPFPEPAVRALGRIAEHGVWRRRPEGTIPPLEAAGDEARLQVHELTAAGARSLRGDEVAVVLTFAGLVVEEAAVANGGEQHAVDVAIGISSDPSFGPLLSFGLAGAADELLFDRAYRVVPLTDVDANELLSSLRWSPLLSGGGGHQAVDVAALCELLLRVSALAEHFAEIRHMELAARVTADGAQLTRAEIRVAPIPAGPGPMLRRLR